MSLRCLCDQPNVDRPGHGEGVVDPKNSQICADILYGWPLITMLLFKVRVNKVAIKNFVLLSGKYQCWRTFFNKNRLKFQPCSYVYIKEDSSTSVFLVILSYTCFAKQLQTTFSTYYEGFKQIDEVWLDIFIVSKCYYKRVLLIEITKFYSWESKFIIRQLN